MKITNAAAQIANIIENAGGEAWITGGACRDTVMGITPRDIDIETFGIEKTSAIEAIRAAGIAAKFAGAAYGIIITTVAGEDIEVSVASDTMEAAAGRRDITANAIYFRPATDEWFDPFDGITDIEAGIIRATPGFPQDPGRMMRAARFAARFGWEIEPATVAMIRAMAPRMTEVAVERIWVEFAKAFEADRPGDFVWWMREIGIVGSFPEIAAMQGCQQDEVWHPEGDAFEHTMHVMNAAADICRRDGITGEDRIAFIAGAMVHDCGKPETTVVNEAGRIASPGHAEVGARIAARFFERCGIATSQVTSRAIAMTAEHMSHANEISPRTVRRIAARIAASGATITDIARIIEADASGRPPCPAVMPEGARRMVEIAESMNVATGGPAPIIMGRHIIAMGCQPGPRIGRICKAAFEAQIEGAFEDEASGIAWVREAMGAIE